MLYIAEVLIVLGIIGVVAELTIPTLMNNVQDAQFKTGAKKAYSVASQAVEMMKANGDSDFTAYTDNVQSLKPVFMTYFKVLQDCGWNNCGAGASYKSLAGQAVDTGLIDDGQFITADGMFWAIENAGNMGGWAYRWLGIVVDVNGYSKKPNVYGKDVFMFQILNDSVVPMGTSGTYFPSSTHCDKNSAITYQGIGCAALLMQGVSY